MSRRPQRSVVAIVSVPARKRLFVVQYKFIELYKEYVLPDSCRNHDSESQESEMSECNCNLFYLKLQFPSGNIELRRNARGTPSAMSSSES